MPDNKNSILKGLFVTPDLRFNGADKSLYELLRSTRMISPDIMIPFWCHSGSEKTARKHLNERKVAKVNELYFRPLPREYCYLGAPSGGLEFVKKQVKKLMWMAYKKKFYRHLAHKKYDFIHLNSITLYPLINDDFPFLVHVRDIVKNPDNKLISHLKRAKGLIFIDAATYSFFREFELPPSIVLPNPFDMTGCKKINPKKVLEKYQIQGSKTIFTFLGAIIPVRGVDKLIQAFRQVHHSDAQLLIVGQKTNTSYCNHCLKLAEKDNRIKFLGHIENVEEIYSISDYVVRAEILFGLHRPLFEGLFSGCSVIMPGKKENIHGVSELAPFSEKIYIFEPDSIDQLVSLMKSRIGHKAIKRQFICNHDNFREKFETFLLDRL